MRIKPRISSITIDNVYNINTENDYRIKIEVIDTYNGKTTSNTYYRYLVEEADI